MDRKGNVVVPGGASGIGKALSERFAVANPGPGDETFMILPQPEAEQYRQGKAADYNR